MVDRLEQVRAAEAGDRRALARLITAVEERAPDVPEISAATKPGSAVVVGITGAPGVGKSTTTAALLKHWRAQDRSVAVVAVDPTSPFTGGALLGDRIRMGEHATDPGVYIRSLATRGRLGGVSTATPGVVRLLSSVGFDIVLVETVGVGQSEIDIISTADVVVILQAPSMGDRIQAAKAGLLEIGDVFVVNKADLPLAKETQRELRAMVAGRQTVGWRPPVLGVSAQNGTGIDKIVTSIDECVAAREESGAHNVRRQGRLRAELQALLHEQLDDLLLTRQAELDTLAAQVAAGDLDLYSAAARFTSRLPFPLLPVE